MSGVKVNIVGLKINTITSLSSLNLAGSQKKGITTLQKWNEGFGEQSADRVTMYRTALCVRDDDLVDAFRAKSG